MRVGRRYLVSGRVQGVGYRMFARESALVEGVHGEVRNLDDGSVEVIAEGDAESMLRFERRLRQGPIGSRVRDVQVDSSPATGTRHGFTIGT
jgi:acylphosphatase